MTEPLALGLLEHIWTQFKLDARALHYVRVPESPASLRSSFRVSTAAQVSIAAAALAANEYGYDRSGKRQVVTVETLPAELECTGYFSLNGTTPKAWAKYSGLHECLDGFVRIHANFDHHRDGVLRLLGLPVGESATLDQLSSSLKEWGAAEFERAATKAGLVVAKMRTFAQWDEEQHALATHGLPLLSISKIADANPLPVKALGNSQPPLSDIRVLDFTRILAGPICGRTLAAYGAEVLLVNSPHLPNIDAITDTSRGKRSAHLDLRSKADRQILNSLLGDAHVFIQGYRPGAITALGYSPEALAERRPGIVAVSLSAFGATGPWSDRRGFDSIVQTATGFNHAEGARSGKDAPKALPVQILDYAAGFFMTFGAQVALLRQRQDGGSWHVEVSLLQIANWLCNLGQVDDGFSADFPGFDDHLREFACDHGVLKALPHAASFSNTSLAWRYPSVLPGTNPASWNDE